MRSQTLIRSSSFGLTGVPLSDARRHARRLDTGEVDISRVSRGRQVTLHLFLMNPPLFRSSLQSLAVWGVVGVQGQEVSLQGRRPAAVPQLVLLCRRPQPDRPLRGEEDQVPGGARGTLGPGPVPKQSWDAYKVWVKEKLEPAFGWRWARPLGPRPCSDSAATSEGGGFALGNCAFVSPSSLVHQLLRHGTPGVSPRNRAVLCQTVPVALQKLQHSKQETANTNTSAGLMFPKTVYSS